MSFIVRPTSLRQRLLTEAARALLLLPAAWIVLFVTLVLRIRVDSGKWPHPPQPPPHVGGWYLANVRSDDMPVHWGVLALMTLTIVSLTPFSPLIARATSTTKRRLVFCLALPVPLLLFVRLMDRLNGIMMCLVTLSFAFTALVTLGVQSADRYRDQTRDGVLFVAGMVVVWAFWLLDPGGFWSLFAHSLMGVDFG